MLLQEQDERIDKLQRDMTAARAKGDKAELRAADAQNAHRRAEELEGSCVRRRQHRHIGLQRPILITTAVHAFILV